MAATKFTETEREKLFAQLEVPFDPAQIKWRVMRTSNDGRTGLLFPFADPLAYTDRLNQLFTPAGWRSEYSISTVPSLTRVERGKVIVTSKILVASAVTINRLGSHAGTGEAWADRDHAATTASAQAFKRACACFGLGRYLYSFGETWVQLNQRGEPVALPVLPTWALPPGVTVQPISGPTVDVRGPVDHRLRPRLRAFAVHWEWTSTRKFYGGRVTAGMPGQFPMPTGRRVSLSGCRQRHVDLSGTMGWLPFLMPREDVATGRPITPLHGGHLGLLCTAGLLNGVFGQGDDRHIARWRSVKHVTNDTLLLMLLAKGLRSMNDGVAICVKDASVHNVREVLEAFRTEGAVDPLALASTVLNKVREKWDYLLPEDLLNASFASANLDTTGVQEALEKHLETA